MPEAGTQKAGLLAQDDPLFAFPPDGMLRCIRRQWHRSKAVTYVHHSGASAAEFHRLPKCVSSTDDPHRLRSRLVGKSQRSDMFGGFKRRPGRFRRQTDEGSRQFRDGSSQHGLLRQRRIERDIWFHTLAEDWFIADGEKCGHRNSTGRAVWLPLDP